MGTYTVARAGVMTTCSCSRGVLNSRIWDVRNPAEITEFARRAPKPEIDPQNQNRVHRNGKSRIWLVAPVALMNYCGRYMDRCSS